MSHKITLQEVTTASDAARFWQEKDQMLLRDVQNACDLTAPMSDAEVEFFLSPQYRAHLDALTRRAEDPLLRVFFREGDREVGFALYCTYRTEDGKCFLLDFCIYPPYRCQGLGKRCFAALAERAAGEGARYFELNTHCRRSLRFWESLGFRYNGLDNYGSILLCRPPEDPLPITVEVLADPEDWQLLKLENGFLHEIGEAPLSEDARTRLRQAIREERITFFLAKRGYRAVGMCSVSRCFSTFSCADSGIFDDFFVEPVFRRQGIARQLTSFAQNWCREQRLASLMVGCSPGDAAMYRSLGFSAELGTMLSCIL